MNIPDRLKSRKFWVLICFGISVVVDSTNVVVYVSEAIHILDKTSFADTAITLGSWDMYVKAVYFG